MQRPLPLVAVLVAAVPTFASAQSSGYYTPPKLVKQGTATSAVAGPGKIVVKVLVNKDGTFKVQSVVSSTNHADDAAALEIAKSSTYRAATKGGSTLTAFYDYTLNFTGSGAASSGDGSGLSSAELMIKGGNYSGAAAALKTYIQAHPTDERAHLDLGLADAFTSDFDGATAEFDKAGTIPQNYRAVVGKSYSEAAVAQIKAKNYDAGIASAKKAVELSPGFATYNTLGFGQFSNGDFTGAIANLEKARSLAASAGIDAKQRALVDVNLVQAYLSAGQPDQAKGVAAEAAQLDASDNAAQVAFANYYAKKAQAAPKPEEAAALYEQAAQAVPSQAVSLYANAALAYLKVDPKPENAKAKADADKALAIDPNNAIANYAAGIALANDGKAKDALTYLTKADTAAKAANDASLAAAIENAMKQLNGTK